MAGCLPRTPVSALPDDDPPAQPIRNSGQGQRRDQIRYMAVPVATIGRARSGFREGGADRLVRHGCGNCRRDNTTRRAAAIRRCAILVGPCARGCCAGDEVTQAYAASRFDHIVECPCGQTRSSSARVSFDGDCTCDGGRLRRFTTSCYGLFISGEKALAGRAWPQRTGAAAESPRFLMTAGRVNR